MARWFKRISLTLLVLAVVYFLAVQVLRWFAFGEEEREALALMSVESSPPTGRGGIQFLLFGDYDIPSAELHRALASDLAAYREWHAGWGERLIESGASEAPGFESPVAAAHAVRPPVDAPEAACGLREVDCLAKLRGHEDTIRAWLQADAARLALAWKALGADHLDNPYPPAIDSPMAHFQMLRLPVNDIALQALDGDVPGATVRACELLAAERRFLAQDGPLVDKIVHGNLVDGGAALVLGLRRMAPDAPLPDACNEALAPVVATDFLVCGALRHEFAMVTGMLTAQDRAMRESVNPRHWFTRWLFTDDRLARAWSAQNFAPMCEPEGIAAILEGRVPAYSGESYEPYSPDYWAAPISHILSAIAAPAYRQYQERLLDHAASLRLHLAAIDAVDGSLPVDEVPAAAASPGYEVTVEEGQWVLPLRAGNPKMGETLRVTLPDAPE